MADDDLTPPEPRTEQVPGVPPAPDEIDITDRHHDDDGAAAARSGAAPTDDDPAARQPAAPQPAAPQPALQDDPVVEAGLDGDVDRGDRADEPAPPLRKIIESILLVVDQPVPEVDLAQVVEAPRAVVLGVLEDLAAGYLADDRGFELRQVAGGWRLYTAPDCAPYIERFVLDGQQARLTQAALETLAVIAYRQPVSRQSVAAIRGVNVDGVVRTLLARGLVAEAGEEGPAGAHLYVTTPYFLERLGLRSLDELPNLAPLLPVDIDDLADHA
jgi:segregation and condensation protein B